MRDGWRQVELGELYLLVTDRVLPRGLDQATIYVGLEHIESGRVSPALGSTVGSVLSAVTPFRANDVLFGRLRPYLRKVALAPTEGVCTPEILVLRPNPIAVLPRFLFDIASSEEVLRRCVELSAGSRMPRTSSADLASIPILLPPLAEQWRIVDLIAAVDAAIEAAERESSSLEDVTVLALGDLYDRMVGPPIPVRDLAQLIVGGSWGKAPGVDECDVIALGTSAYSGDSVSVDSGTGTLRSLSAKKRDSRVLQQGDIVLERSGGSEDQPVGRVIRVADPLTGHVVPSDFMRLVRINASKADPTYVFWVMWLRYKRGETVHFQIKSTNIRNLRIPEYLATPITVPSPQEQHAFVDLAEDLLSGRGSVASVMTAQTSIRNALLSDLLSGDHEIPDRYDELLSA